MKTSLPTFILFVLIAAATRFMPWPMNFSPLMGLVFFAGAHFMSRRAAFAASFLALFVSDLYFGFYESMWITYLAFAAVAYIGHFFLSDWSHRSLTQFLPSWGFGVLFSSVAFFLISNFGVWTEGIMYTRDLTGLWTCFVMGLPFFKFTILSTGLFSAVAFGLTRFATKLARKMVKQKI